MSGLPDVVVVRTGSANLASVLAALERLGASPRLSEDAVDVGKAPLVVLPGVGAFGPAMKRLAERGLDDVLIDRVRCGLPLLAICLGMQLLCESSEESPGVPGLGVVPGRVARFNDTLTVPHMGWNTITPTPRASLLRSGSVYFANSYRLGELPPGWEGASCEYARSFAAAIERGPLLACQFHPELSGAFGLALIKRWLDGAMVAGASTC